MQHSAVIQIQPSDGYYRPQPVVPGGRPQARRKLQSRSSCKGVWPVMPQGGQCSANRRLVRNSSFAQSAEVAVLIGLVFERRVPERGETEVRSDLEVFSHLLLRFIQTAHLD